MEYILFTIVSIVLALYIAYVRVEINDLNEKNTDITKKLNKVYNELFREYLQVNSISGVVRTEEINKIEEFKTNLIESEKYILNKLKKLEEYLDVEYVKLETKVEKYDKKRHFAGEYLGFFAAKGGTPVSESSEVCTKKVAKKTKSKKK